MDTPILRVLLVEDNPTDALLVREALAEIPSVAFVVIQVERLAEGLKHLTETGGDVVLLDLGLPDSQGLETLLAMREAVPHVPIVVLTGLADEGLGIGAVQHGAQDYLVKGQVDGQLLVRAIRYAIERQRAEVVLRATQERLAALGRLAAGIAHELNNPLSRLLLEVGLLKEDLAEGQLSAAELLSQYIPSLEAAAGRMQRIMHGLSTYAKPPLPDPTLLRLDELLAATRELVAYAARQNRVTVVVDTPAPLPLVVGDRSQLMQVLLNLATNALEAMAETGGQLTLSARLQADGARGQEGDVPLMAPTAVVIVNIADTGPGIPPEQLPLIWEPFYTTKAEGTGLGLAIVRALVREQPGATIAIESRPGHGTTVTLTLPVAQRQ